MKAQSLLRCLSILVPLIVALPVGAAEIAARISHDTIRVGQPFSLFLDAKGEVEAPPDLSVLHSAFEVLGRHQRRNVQVINGRSIHRASLTLTLRPKSSGKLTIPSIRFGKDRSQPIGLEVTGGDQGPPQAWQEPRALRPSEGYLSAPQIPEKKAVSPPLTPTQAIAVDQHPAVASNIWPWVALFLALGWALTVGVWAANRRRGSQERSEHVPKKHRVESTAHTPPSALDVALKQVQDACSSRDAERTKSALLDWARQRWPENPPSNLSSLARRCPQDVSKGILDFERSLYSPDTEPWFEQPVWKRFAEITTQRGKNAA